MKPVTATNNYKYSPTSSRSYTVINARWGPRATRAFSALDPEKKRTVPSGPLAGTVSDFPRMCEGRGDPELQEKFTEFIAKKGWDTPEGARQTVEDVFGENRRKDIKEPGWIAVDRKNEIMPLAAAWQDFMDSFLKALRKEAVKITRDNSRSRAAQGQAPTTGNPLAPDVAAKCQQALYEVDNPDVQYFLKALSNLLSVMPHNIEWEKLNFARDFLVAGPSLTADQRTLMKSLLSGVQSKLRQRDPTTGTPVRALPAIPLLTIPAQKDPEETPRQKIRLTTKKIEPISGPVQQGGISNSPAPLSPRRSKISLTRKDNPTGSKSQTPRLEEPIQQRKSPEKPFSPRATMKPASEIIYIVPTNHPKTVVPPQSVEPPRQAAAIKTALDISKQFQIALNQIQPTVDKTQLKELGRALSTFLKLIACLPVTTGLRAIVERWSSALSMGTVPTTEDLGELRLALVSLFEEAQDHMPELKSLSTQT